jgi:hypothetical protein
VSTQSLLGWIACVTARLLPSQSRTLALLVATAIRLDRPSLAQIGRKMPGQVAPSTSSSAWRFICNDRIEVADAMVGVNQRLVRKRNKLSLVSFDWVAVRAFHTLRAADCIGGRAVPLLWASYPQQKLRRSQNSLEEGLLRLLRTLIAESAIPTRASTSSRSRLHGCGAL